MTAQEELEILVKSLALILTELQKLNLSLAQVLAILETQEERIDKTWREQNG